MNDPSENSSLITKIIHAIGKSPLRFLWIWELVGIAAFGFICWNGFSFWRSHDSMTWQTCVYGDAVCSTAAATWALGGFGLLTFIAACQAVIWAKRAFRMEVEPKLGQSICARHGGDDHPTDKAIYLMSSGQIVFRPPVGATPESIALDYQPYPNAFEVLGRSALADVKVNMHLRDMKGQMSVPYTISVGNIKCDKEVHLVLYVAKIFDRIDVMWSDATERGKAIAFFPESPLVQEVELGLDDNTQIDLPLVPQAQPPTTAVKTVAKKRAPRKKIIAEIPLESAIIGVEEYQDNKHSNDEIPE